MKLWDIDFINFWNELEQLSQMNQLKEMKDHYHKSYMNTFWNAFLGFAIWFWIIVSLVFMLISSDSIKENPNIVLIPPALIILMALMDIAIQK